VEQKDRTPVRELLGYLRYDTATTPHQRAITGDDMHKRPIIQMDTESTQLKTAAQSHNILALTGELEALAVTKKPAGMKPAQPAFQPVNPAEVVS
jgi:hypothetical protein